MSKQYAFVIAATSSVLVACDRLPLGPSGVVTYLRGFVRDTVGRPVSDVVVEILDGPRAGARTTSDGRGTFEFAGGPSGAVILRASRTGFVSTTTSAMWSANPNERTSVTLKTLEPPLEIAPGAYTMALISDPGATGWFGATCSGFPADLLRRTYEASISPATLFEGLLVQFTSPTLIAVPAPFGFGFAFKQAGHFVGFELELGFGSGPTEELSDYRYVTISGTAPTAEPARLTGQSLIIPFWGTFEYCRLTAALGGYNACSQVPVTQRIEYHACTSMHDLMVFTKP